MKKYCGMLKRVGSHESTTITSGGAVGNVQVAGDVSVVQIGDTVLRKPRCTSDLFDLLDPGREACLYVFPHFFYYPVIIGVKYADDGSKYTITFGQLVANVASYLLMWPLLFVVGAFMFGILLPAVGFLILFGGIGLAWLSALMLVLDFSRMKAD